MHDKNHEKSPPTAPRMPVNPLKKLSEAEFAALGAQSIVFVHEMDASELLRLIPETGVDPDAGPMQLLMSADGTPMLVTDSPEALDAWLEDRPVEQVTVH